LSFNVLPNNTLVVICWIQKSPW